MATTESAAAVEGMTSIFGSSDRFSTTVSLAAAVARCLMCARDAGRNNHPLLLALVFETPH